MKAVRSMNWFIAALLMLTPLSALAQADGWILIAPDSEGYPEQSDVVVRPWP